MFKKFEFDRLAEKILKREVVELCPGTDRSKIVAPIAVRLKTPTSGLDLWVVNTDEQGHPIGEPYQVEPKTIAEARGTSIRRTPPGACVQKASVSIGSRWCAVQQWYRLVE